MEKRLTTKEVQNIYGVSEKTLCEWKRKYGMPHRKIGRLCFYDLMELQEWDNAHKLPREPKMMTRSKRAHVDSDQVHSQKGTNL